MPVAILTSFPAPTEAYYTASLGDREGVHVWRGSGGRPGMKNSD